MDQEDQDTVTILWADELPGVGFAILLMVVIPNNNTGHVQYLRVPRW